MFLIHLSRDSSFLTKLLPNVGCFLRAVCVGWNPSRAGHSSHLLVGLGQDVSWALVSQVS